MPRNRSTIFLLLFLHGVLLGWIAFQETPRKTEVAHLPAGIYSWNTGKFDSFSVNPPLVRMYATLPLVCLSPETNDWKEHVPISHVRSEWLVATYFLRNNGRAKSCWFFTIARWFCIPISLIGAYFSYRLASELFGRGAGIVTLGVWTFSPTILTAGASICPEMASTTAGVLAIYALRNWLRRPSMRSLFCAGMLLGVLLLTKFTWIVAFAIWPFIWIAFRFNNNQESSSWKQLTVLFFIAVYIINLGYAFEGAFRPLGQFKFVSHALSGIDNTNLSGLPTQGNRFTETLLGHIPMPFPANMVQGIDTQRLDFERGLPSYVRGEHSDHGWWYYYLYALLVKMPLGTWGLFFLAVVCSLFLKGYNAAWRDEMIVILPGLTLFLFVSSQTGFSVHSRYIIPALPFLFIWISKVGRAFTREVKELNPRSTKWVRGLAVFFLAWMIGSSLWVYPHSLSYFNELAAVLPTPYDDEYPTPITSSDAKEKSAWEKVKHVLNAGPRNGPRHLLDSNIDWGQDLFYLEDWYESHPEARPMRVAYWGSYPLELSKIESEGRPPTEPMPGWYALSVNEIYGRSKQYQYFLNFEPVDMAGYSIYIYHITLDDANRVRRELGLPELDDDEIVGNGGV